MAKIKDLEQRLDYMIKSFRNILLLVGTVVLSSGCEKTKLIDFPKCETYVSDTIPTAAEISYILMLNYEKYKVNKEENQTTYSGRFFYKIEVPINWEVYTEEMLIDTRYGTITTKKDQTCRE